jgi:site-specific recombinase XerD
MKGCRSLSDQEMVNIFNELKGTRNKTLFWLGCKTGLRISELLSLRLSDVMEYGRVGSQVTVAKKNTKGKIESRVIPMSESARKVVQEHLDTLDLSDLNKFLFQSSQGKKAISRIMAHKILDEVFEKLKLTGKISTHSMRKSYAKRVHEALGSRIELTQKAMGHKSLSSTASYLQVNQEEIVAAILSQG